MIHVVVITHTSQGLVHTLNGLAAQHRQADSITISCDGDLPAIMDLARRVLPSDGPEAVLVCRPHTGVSQSGQARNNAVRILIGSPTTVDDESLLVFLDGDCAPDPRLLATYESDADKADLLVGFRVDLTQRQTDALGEDGAAPTATLSGSQIESLDRRRRRSRRQLALRRFWLTKAHKPKIVGANFAVRLSVFSQINGFDERYTGWGLEDDDLARRAYAAGARPGVVGDGGVVYHLHHPTRAPANWSDSPGAKRFQEKTPTRCVAGVENPAPQPEPVVCVVSRRAVAV